MFLRTLRLQNLRNLEPATFVPEARFTVLWGDNGQGKTNFLEAIYLVATLRSFRTTHLPNLVAWGAEEAHVAAEADRGGLERRYDVILRPGKKQVLLDGKTPQSLGEYFGGMNVVTFAPEDLRVLRGTPSGRRRFLDRAVFNRHVTFLEDAQRYAHVLRQRNTLLKQGGADAVLDVYDEQLAAHGERVDAARRRTLDELAPRFAAAFAAISRSGLAAAVRYDAPPRPPGSLLAELGAGRARDRLRRHTGVGPHTDDLVFSLDGRDARAFASQGQLRALVLAWKAAEMSLLVEVRGDAPLLLLDDVSSELDPLRNQYLFDLLHEIDCQCFVTTTHPRHVLVADNRKDYQVVNGTIRPFTN
ncbi:MAG TPA: DNA replication/repair protein RecF [Haliangiales bacterium]|nr:DNA replication/repair protein RecF [Haliangiales bacterium]